jgi:nucleotide-binding universal stress UspA family protein
MGTLHTAVKSETNLFAGKLIHLARILVATDFSPASERAVDYAVSLAKLYDSHIYLTHIISGDSYPLTAPEVAISMIDERRDLARDCSAKIVASGRLRDVPYDIVIQEGPLWATLKEVIEDKEIELVVAGTHGSGAFHKVLLGSGAEQIFRHAAIPVLTIGPAAQPPSAEAGFKSILFATDFGLCAERQAAFAFSLAQEHEAKITLLHVVQHADDYTESGLTLKKEAITQQLQHLVPGGAELWCQPEFRTTFGSPVEDILRIAGETKADLIVMGAKPRGGFIGHNPRTNAYRVVCNAKCPVLTVRS